MRGFTNTGIVCYMNAGEGEGVYVRVCVCVYVVVSVSGRSRCAKRTVFARVVLQSLLACHAFVNLIENISWHEPSLVNGDTPVLNSICMLLGEFNLTPVGQVRKVESGRPMRAALQSY